MGSALALSYVVHVLAATLWVGGTLYAVLALRAKSPAPAAVGPSLDTLLWVTRWTGVALPLTGLYQAWALYPLERLLGTTRGHLVLTMALLWGPMNGLVELGVYRARTVETPVSPVRYLARGVRADGGLPDGAGGRALRAARPYLLAAAALGVALAADAALLAGGLAAL